MASAMAFRVASSAKAILRSPNGTSSGSAASPAMRVGSEAGSKLLIGAMPERPASRSSMNSATS
jgi:hypothetical protein